MTFHGRLAHESPLLLQCHRMSTSRTIRGREKFKGRIVALLSPSLSHMVRMILGVLKGRHEQRELQGSE